jgi:hypothetical protein
VTFAWMDDDIIMKDSPSNCAAGSHFPLVELYVGLHVQCPLLMSDLNQNLTVSTNISKTPHIQIL